MPFVKKEIISPSLLVNDAIPIVVLPGNALGILQYLQNIRFLIQSLALHHVIRNHPECPVLLQCAPAYPQDFGEFLVSEEALTVKRDFGIFSITESIFSIFSNETSRRSEGLLSSKEMIAHNLLFIKG